MRALPTLGGNNALAFGGANDQQEIVGTAESGVRDPTCTAPQAFDWKPVVWGPGHGRIRELRQNPWRHHRRGERDQRQRPNRRRVRKLWAAHLQRDQHALLWQGR